MREIPVVDMRAPELMELSEGARRNQIGDKIVRALEGIGFVYLKNTDISKKVQQATIDTALEFFALPLEDKLKYHRFVKTKTLDGYSPMGEEQLAYSEEGSEFDGVSELKETYDISFPDAPLPRDIAPAFTDNALQMRADLDKLSQYLYAAIEESLGRPGLLTSTHTRQLDRGNATDFRVSHYPPVPQQAARRGQVRCCTHSDWGSLTLLLQDDVGGLEVLARDDTWVPATPIPDTVLLNVGDLMEFWTGGRLRATKHRILYPDTVEKCRSHRISLVFFGIPDEEVMVEPPAELADQWPACNVGEYLQKKCNATMPNAIDLWDN